METGAFFYYCMGSGTENWETEKLCTPSRADRSMSLFLGWTKNLRPLAIFHFSGICPCWNTWYSYLQSDDGWVAHYMIRWTCWWHNIHLAMRMKFQKGGSGRWSPSSCQIFLYSNVSAILSHFPCNADNRIWRGVHVFALFDKNQNLQLSGYAAHCC